MELLKDRNHKKDIIQNQILLKRTAMIRCLKISPQKLNLIKSSPMLIIRNAPTSFRLLMVISTLYEEKSSTAGTSKCQLSIKDDQAERGTFRNLKWEIFQKCLNRKQGVNIYNKLYHTTPLPRHHAAIFRPNDFGSLKRQTHSHPQKQPFQRNRYYPIHLRLQKYYHNTLIPASPHYFHSICIKIVASGRLKKKHLKTNVIINPEIRQPNNFLLVVEDMYVSHIVIKIEYVYCHMQGSVFPIWFLQPPE
ncbi:hypothetical protein ACTXT7_010174 [Hymenolepis weldensis]